MSNEFKSGNLAFEKWWDTNYATILAVDVNGILQKRLWFKAWIQEGLEKKP